MAGFDGLNSYAGVDGYAGLYTGDGKLGDEGNAGFDGLNSYAGVDGYTGL